MILCTTSTKNTVVENTQQLAATTDTTDLTACRGYLG